MRRALAVAVIVGACGQPTAPAKPATPPANRVEDPAAAAARDPLAFLPLHANYVIGLDLKALRASALWHEFMPAIQSGIQRASENPAFRNCIAGSVDSIGRITFGFDMTADGDPTGVAVLSGVDAPTMLNCLEREMRTAKLVQTVDRGVVIGQTAKAQKIALGAAGASSIVAQLDAAASYDSFAKMLADGTPLRGSPGFLAVYDHLEHGASLWAVINGKATLFAQLSSAGVHGLGADGTIVVTDKIAIVGRLTVDSPDAAANLASMAASQVQAAKSMFERVDVTSSGPVVKVEAALTSEQLRQLMQLFTSR